MNRKGQAALEFLTTYGWAFLVILVMIGALAYFGVLNPTKFVPDSCTFAAPFSCDDAVVNTGDTTFRFRNNGEALVITGISITDLDIGQIYSANNPDTVLEPNGTCTAGTSNEIICPAGGVATLTWDAAASTSPSIPATFGTAGAKKKISVDIDYYYSKSGTSFGKSTGGDIVGSVQ